MVLRLNHCIPAQLRACPVARLLGPGVNFPHCDERTLEFLERFLADPGERLVDGNRGIGQQAAQITLRDRRQPRTDFAPLALTDPAEIFVS